MTKASRGIPCDPYLLNKALYQPGLKLQSFRRSHILKDLPVQSFPVYPVAHAHCDDEHTVFANTSVH